MIGLVLGVSLLIVACIVSVWHMLGYYQAQLGDRATRRQAMVTLLKSFIGR